MMVLTHERIPSPRYMDMLEPCAPPVCKNLACRRASWALRVILEDYEQEESVLFA